jgi:tetratricopeptide (TPR) repeat protein
MIWAQKGENDIALRDFSEAIQLDPNNKWAYLNRGVALKAKKEYDNAISDFNEAIRLDPKIALAYCCRGILWKSKGEYDKALADYNEAIRLDPKDAEPWIGRAWLAATCPDARFRDGNKTIEDATKAGELSGWKKWNGFDTLAAGYAESGDFPNAVIWAEKAIERAPEKSKGELRSRLDLYKARKPYREEVTKQANGLDSAPVRPVRRGGQSPPE